MSSNYQQMTGVLILDEVTPVISALYSGFNLDGTLPGNGKVSIAFASEGDDASWDSIAEHLEGLATSFGLKIDSVDTKELLEALAAHFKADQNSELRNLIDREDFNNDVSLDSLFVIAKAFNDGHGLKAYMTETAMTCSRPLLFEFGGYGDFTGTHVAISSGSNKAPMLGEALETALANGDTETVAKTLCSTVDDLLAGIYDDAVRAEVRRKLSNALAQ